MMGWALLPLAFVLGVVAGAWSILRAFRDARSARPARVPQRPALRVIAGGRR
jgi:hypothetical protein